MKVKSVLMTNPVLLAPNFQKTISAHGGCQWCRCWCGIDAA